MSRFFFINRDEYEVMQPDTNIIPFLYPLYYFPNREDGKGGRVKEQQEQQIFSYTFNSTT